MSQSFARALVSCSWLLATMVCVPCARAVDFDLGVLPILTKAGCNSGACHGAAVGRGGFRLSLYGQNPKQDWENITRELGGRRIHLSDPEQSLLLRKAGEFIEHGGGEALSSQGDGWHDVLRWIEAGAQRQGELTIKRLRVELELATLDQAERETTELKVFAELTNGEVRDVTRWAITTPHDEASVRTELVRHEASDESTIRVRAIRSGRHVLMVRFRDQITAAEVIRPFTPSESVASPDANPREAEGIVDRSITARLQQLRIVPETRADDWTLLRRVTLDLVGRLPTDQEIDTFLLGDANSRYRDHVEQLLDSKPWARYWSVWLSQSLRLDELSTLVDDTFSGEHLATYMEGRMLRDASVLPLFSELVASDGTVREQPTGVFYQLGSNGRERAEVFSEVMLGTRMRCANCHDHPLDVWTQDDYHGLAAMLAGIRAGAEVSWNAGAINMHPNTGQAATPQLPDGTIVSATSDPRPVLASWLAGPGRAPLARNWCNRVWAELMGKGLVDPVDDHRITNPSWHPELLDALVAEWMDRDGDLKWLIREIVFSDAYCRKTVDADSADSLQRVQAYAGRMRKPLRTAVYLDALADITGVTMQQQTGDTRRFAYRVYLNKPERRPNSVDGCPGAELCESDFNDSLAGRLAAIAGPLINQRIKSSDGTMADRRRNLPRDARAEVEWLFQSCFTQPAKEEIVANWSAEIKQAEDPQAVWNDLVWAVLSSERFRTNW